jgi:hypothetical protein
VVAHPQTNACLPGGRHFTSVAFISNGAGFPAHWLVGMRAGRGGAAFRCGSSDQNSPHPPYSLPASLSKAGVIPPLGFSFHLFLHSLGGVWTGCVPGGSAYVSYAGLGAEIFRTHPTPTWVPTVPSTQSRGHSTSGVFISLVSALPWWCVDRLRPGRERLRFLRGSRS